MKNKKQPPKKFNRDDGTKFTYIPIESSTRYCVWVQQEVVEEITLSEEEQNKAHILGYDLEKVLIVKTRLDDGETPTFINEETGISRDAIYRYKKIFDPKDSKKPLTDTDSTPMKESVLSMLLIFNNTGINSTMSLYVVVVPIVVLAIFSYLKREYDTVQTERAQHTIDTKLLYKLMRDANDYSYCRYPIIVSSETEEAYYKKVLAHYHNEGRMVHLIPYTGGNRNEHYDAKLQFEREFGASNGYDVKRGNERASRNWREMEEEGLLDYLYHSRKYKGKWERSQIYMEAVTQFLLENPGPVTIDRAKSKTIETLRPKA